MRARIERGRPARLGLLIAALSLIAAACGPTVSPSPSATVTATPPAPTPSPVASALATPAPSAPASPAGSGSAAIDPADDLTLNAPYEFAPLNALLEEQLRASMTASLGSMSSIVQVGAREVRKDGASAGFLIAMRMPGVPGIEDPSFLDSIVGGAAGSSGGQVEERQIGGQPVQVVVSPAATFGVFQVDDVFVFAYGTTEPDMTGIVEALIEANS
jgi:hypothetical protein